MNFCFFHNHLWQTEILGLHQHVLSYEVLGSNSELPICYGILYRLHSQPRDRFLNFVFSLGFMCGRCTLALLLIFNSALLFMFLFLLSLLSLPFIYFLHLFLFSSSQNHLPPPCKIYLNVDIYAILFFICGKIGITFSLIMKYLYLGVLGCFQLIFITKL